jgi:regulatory protein
MARITAIEPQKREPDRVNIHLDGTYAFGLSRLVAAWLKVGQELADERIASLQRQDAAERAYQQAMLFLSYRARSEAEIRQNLRKHEVPDEIIEQTLQRLRENRLADDASFAHSWVENRSTFRPRSRRALSVELRRKGLSEADTQAALAGVDEAGMAYAAGLKKARRLAGLEWNDFRRKLSEHLARRGFAYSVMAPIITRIWNETHAQKHYLDEEEHV